MAKINSAPSIPGKQVNHVARDSICRCGNDACAMTPMLLCHRHMPKVPEQTTIRSDAADTPTDGS